MAVEESKQPTIGIDHMVLFVSDLQRSTKFYAEQLGLEIAYQDNEMVQVKGRGSFSILLEPDASRVGGPGIELELLVDDVDEEHARLLARGVVFDEPPKDMSWGARHAFFKDPDGYSLTIFRSTDHE